MNKEDIKKKLEECLEYFNIHGDFFYLVVGEINKSKVINSALAFVEYALVNGWILSDNDENMSYINDPSTYTIRRLLDGCTNKIRTNNYHLGYQFLYYSGYDLSEPVDIPEKFIQVIRPQLQVPYSKFISRNYDKE